MENSSESSLFDSSIDDIAINELNAVGKWVKRIAVVSLVFIGFVMLLMIFMGVAISSLSSYLPLEYSRLLSDEMSGSIFLVIFSVVMILGGLYILLLYKFGNNLIKATTYQDQEALETAFISYKTYLIITGVLGIVGLLFTLIGILN